MDDHLPRALAVRLERAEELLDAEQYGRAAAVLRKAVRLHPTSALAYSHLAEALSSTHQRDDTEEAVRHLQAAIAGGGVSHMLHHNLASLLAKLEREAEATPHYFAAWRLAPHIEGEALARGLSARMGSCDWSDAPLAEYVLRWEEGYRHMGMLELNRLGRPELALAVALERSRGHAEAAAEAASPRAPARGGNAAARARAHAPTRAPLRIGYLSADMASVDHPMRRLIAPLLRLHSAAGSMDGKRRIKVVLFNVVARDENRGSGADAIAGVPVQHIAASVGAAAVADAVSRRAVHLLVDLSSHTAGGRLDALAHHPAPVSVSALGYAGTSGATFVHYLPVDRVAVPPPLSRHYVERNVHLPHSVHPAQHAAERATPLAHWRGAFGSRAVVGSWNSERKLGPNDWHLWGNVLRASPLTVLQQAVAWPEADSARRLGDELLAAGLHARRRLALPTRVSQSEHHARVRATDLGLDVPLWNGASTSLDVLWAGCPLLALPLAMMASRLSASMLASIALPQATLHSQREYEQMVLSLLRSHTPPRQDSFT